MRDVQLIELAARQFNRISRQQLLSLGYDSRTIERRVAASRLIPTEEGVYAVAPLLRHDEWGKWMGATLTSPESYLSHVSAGAAREYWTFRRDFETVTRPGNGGPVRHGGVLVFRSQTLAADVEELNGIPITSVPRTLLDLARIGISDRALARAVREAVRLRRTSTAALTDYLIVRKGFRGTRRLARTLARYSGLPLDRARSGAEVLAMEILRDARRPMPLLNDRIAGEEADLSWREYRLIIEIDGGPFHLDVGEDARKQALWEAAGWEVRRIDSDDVYERPHVLLALSPP
jgi:hypothetical protein